MIIKGCVKHRLGGESSALWWNTKKSSRRGRNYITFWYLQKAWKSVRGKNPVIVFSAHLQETWCAWHQMHLMDFETGWGQLLKCSANGFGTRRALSSHTLWPSYVQWWRAFVIDRELLSEFPFHLGHFSLFFFYIQNLNRDCTACHSFWKKNYVQ